MQYTLLFGEAGSQPLRLAHKEVMSMTHILLQGRGRLRGPGRASGQGGARPR